MAGSSPSPKYVRGWMGCSFEPREDTNVMDGESQRGQGSELLMQLREDRARAMRELLELRQQRVAGQRITGLHPADADDTFSEERLREQRRSVLEERVRSLERAIERFERDGVIRCEGCGEFIAPKRIRIAPAVTRCVSCQRDHEAEQAAAARPAKIAFC